MDNNSYRQYLDYIRMHYRPHLPKHQYYLDRDRIKEIIERMENNHCLNNLNEDNMSVINYIFDFYYNYYDILELICNFEGFKRDNKDDFYHTNISILNQLLIINNDVPEKYHSKLTYLMKACSFMSEIEKKYSLWNRNYNTERNYYLMVLSIIFFINYPNHDKSILENIMIDIIKDYNYFIDELTLDGIDSIFKSIKPEDVKHVYDFLEIYIDRKVLNTRVIK